MLYHPHSLQLAMKKYVKKLKAVESLEGSYVTGPTGEDGEGETEYENNPQPYIVSCTHTTTSHITAL